MFDYMTIIKQTFVQQFQLKVTERVRPLNFVISDKTCSSFMQSPLIFCVFAFASFAKLLRNMKSVKQGMYNRAKFDGLNKSQE